MSSLPASITDHFLIVLVLASSTDSHLPVSRGKGPKKIIAVVKFIGMHGDILEDIVTRLDWSTLDPDHDHWVSRSERLASNLERCIEAVSLIHCIDFKFRRAIMFHVMNLILLLQCSMWIARWRLKLKQLSLGSVEYTRPRGLAKEKSRHLIMHDKFSVHEQYQYQCYFLLHASTKDFDHKWYHYCTKSLRL